MSSHDFSHPAYSPPLTKSTTDTFIFLNFPPKFVPGVSSPVAWTLNLNGTISLKLLQGPTGKAQSISTIAHFIENKGSFFWTPSISIAPGENYYLQIVSDDDEELFVYSPRFSITDYVVRRHELDASFASSAIVISTSHATTATAIVGSTTRASISSPSPLTLQTISSLKISTQSSESKASSTETISLHSSSSLETSKQTSATFQSLTYTSATSSATNSATNSATSSAVVAAAGGLSTGAAAGIGVGATFGGLAIIAGIIFLIYRLKRRQRQQPPDPTQPSVAELGVGKSPEPEFPPEKLPEKEIRPDPRSPQMAELGAPLSPAEYSELDSRRRAAQLEGRSALHAELQANPRAELEARRTSARQIYEIGPAS